MAKRKRKTRKAPMSAGPKRHRKSTRRRRKTGLSSGGGLHTLAVNSVKHTISAATGGLAAVYINKWMPANWGKGSRVLSSLAVGAVGAYFGYPVLSAGAVGGLAALTFPNGVLSDEDMSDENFADQDVLSDMPLFLDESGSPMVLEESSDGSAGYRYLSDSEISAMEADGRFDAYTEVGED